MPPKTIKPVTKTKKQKTFLDDALDVSLDDLRALKAGLFANPGHMLGATPSGKASTKRIKELADKKKGK